MSPRYIGADDYVCRCLRIDECTLRQAAASGALRTLEDVIRRTGAGDGCTGCHRRLQEFLSGEPVAR